MTHNVAHAINDVRVNFLAGGHPERRNLLSIALGDTTGTSVVLTHEVTGIAPNSRISIGLEDMHVYTVNPTTKTLTVTRGDYGTTAATHSADDVVLVGSLHSNAAILDTFNDVLKELAGRGLYDVDHVELTFSSATDGYDLTGTTNLIEVIDVETKAFIRTDWHRLDISEWRLVQTAETDDFASGNALLLTHGRVAYNGQPLRVWYKKRFTGLTTLTEDIETASGLSDDAYDLLPLGAAVRLSSGTPLLRNDLMYQPDPRRADEVPAGATIAAPSNLRRIYEQRIRQELDRQERRYPTRLRGAV